MWQEDRFSRRWLSGRSWFSQQTLAETRGNGHGAPIPDPRQTMIGRVKSKTFDDPPLAGSI